MKISTRRNTKKLLTFIFFFLLVLSVFSFDSSFVSASTETLRPNGNGDVTDLPYQYPDSGYHYDKVDDVSSDGDSTYVYRTVGTSDIYDLYSLSDHTGSGLINSVKIYIVVRVIAGQDCNFKIVIKTGGSVYKTNSIQHSTSTWTTYATEYTTNPQTGQAWTWAEIDSLQAGVGIICDWGEDGFCTQVYVVVDYTPNTTPSADTPTVQGYSSSPQKDHITDSTPTLGWTFNDNGDGDTQDGFEVEVWTGSGGTGTNMLDTGEQVSTAQSYTYDGSALSDGSTYYYRVKVKDSQGTWSDWSELAFTMNTEPTAPSLSSPADGSETTDTTPDLVVNNGTDAESDALTYYFEIDTADTFDTANKQSSSGVSEGASTTTWTVPNALTDNTVWYWRCRSYDGYEYSSWMTTVSVVVNTANDSPNAFDLSSPDDASTVTTTPALIWEVSTDPDPNDTVTYTVEIDDTDSTFSSPEVTKTGLTSNSYDVTEADGLVGSTTYYWRVKAIDNHSAETTSTTYRTFTTSATNSPPVCTNTTPADADTITDANPLFEWSFSDSDDDTQMYFEVLLRTSTGSYGDADSKDSGVVSSSSHSYTPTDWNLGDGTYYWKVRANDGTEWGNYSTETSFTNPTNPTAVTITNVIASSTYLKVQWTKNTDSNFASYKVYKSSSDTVSDSDSLIATITNQDTTEYTDTTNGTWYYRVYVYSTWGESSASNTMGSTTTEGSSGGGGEITQDSDGDGVIDSLDDCPNTPRGTQVDSHGCPIQQSMVSQEEEEQRPLFWQKIAEIKGIAIPMYVLMGLLIAVALAKKMYQTALALFGATVFFRMYGEKFATQEISFLSLSTVDATIGKFSVAVPVIILYVGIVLFAYYFGDARNRVSRLLMSFIICSGIQTVVFASRFAFVVLWLSFFGYVWNCLHERRNSNGFLISLFVSSLIMVVFYKVMFS